MKNLIIIASFAIVIPLSFVESANKGCHSPEKEKTELKKNDSKEENAKNDLKNNSTPSAGNGAKIYCYPFTHIE